MTPQHRTLGYEFTAYCDAAPDAIALETADRKTRLSRGDYRNLVATAVVALGGIGGGGRIVLALPNSPEFAVWFWACQVAGLVPVPVEPFRSGPRLSQQLQAVGRIVDITGAEAIIAPRADELGSLGTNHALRWIGSDISRGQTELVLAPCMPTDLALIQFTSGSTGDPKGCALSHANMILNTKACLAVIGQQPGDAAYTWMPFHHDMGLMSGVIAPVLAGAMSVMETPRGFMLDPLGWLRKMSRYPRIHTTAPNFALSLALRAMRRRQDTQLSLGCVRSIICGAEPIDPDLVREFMTVFEPFGLDRQVFVGCYGMAETTVLVSARAGGLRTVHADKHSLELLGRYDSTSAGPQARELVSLGRPVADGRVAIDGPAIDRPDREVGEIWLRSPCVMSGYFANPAATSAALEEGWLRTGDNGFTLDGEIYFVGRKKELLIVSGQNLDPYDIELRLSDAVGIDARRLCATQADLPGRGSSLVIALEEVHAVRSQDDLGPAITEACFNITGVRPLVIVLKGRRFPRTSSGKLQRSTVGAWCFQIHLEAQAG